MKTVLSDNLFRLSDILTHDECLALIERGESLGFTRAAVRTSSGAQMRPDIRDNDRVQFHDSDLAMTLWQRCAEFVPRELEGGTVAGFDTEFKFYRYDVDQRFLRHKDGMIRRDATTRSRLTCLFYLNDGFDGGETVFYSDIKVDNVRHEAATVVPRTGDALFFQHEWWHEGRGVKTGRKYVLRSDVFYCFDDQS
ncbi:MAG: 2OG-Fe(II) oxygenase [Planctomycetota bacterium]